MNNGYNVFIVYVCNDHKKYNHEFKLDEVQIVDKEKN